MQTNAPASFDMELFEEVRSIISEVTFIEASDIYPDSLLNQELEISPDARNLQEITKRLNTTFQLELTAKQIATEADNVADIVNLISDEVEY